MVSTARLQGQIKLAQVVTSLWNRGLTDLASDIVLLTASRNGQHVMFDSGDLDSVFMWTLHELLDRLGFENIMKLSRDKAEKIAKTPQGPDRQTPANIAPTRNF